MIIDVTLYSAAERTNHGNATPGVAHDHPKPARPRGTVQVHPPAPPGLDDAEQTTPEPTEVEDASKDRFTAFSRRVDTEKDFVLRLYLRDLSDSAREIPIKLKTDADPGELDDSDRQQLVIRHLPKVVHMAFDYQGFGLPLGDLINEGNLGLMRAAELFDPLRNVRFSYYARPWIRVQMQRALNYQAWPVSLPADFSWRHHQVRSAEERLTARLDREPSDAEVASECRLELPAVRRLRAAPTPSFVSLESPCPDDESELTLGEVIPDKDSPAPDSEAALRGDREYVEHLLTSLTPGEQQVIRLRYGLDDGNSRTLEEVGGLLGYGRQGIHRIESVALGKMRQHARFLEMVP